METLCRSRRGRQPLYEALADRMAGMVEQGVFKAGERVPSLRELSRQMQVSLNTAREAYATLEARRIIEARPQSGYYVCSRRPARLAETVDLEQLDVTPADITTGELVQRIFQDALNPGLVQLGAACPAAESIPLQKLSRYLAAESRRQQEQSACCLFTPGSDALRTQVARHMLQAGCTLRAADIVSTTGCTEAIHLALRATCKPGDTLAVESPVYFNFIQLIQELGLKVVEIPSTPSGGMSLEALAYALEQTPIHACFCITNFNNPLGGLMPDDRKRALVELLERHNVPLIEDDLNGDLIHGADRPCVAKAFDRTGNVLLCSSFSKTLAPGYRVGWIAPGRFLPEVTRLKLTFNYASPSPTQLAVAAFLASGDYDRHLRHVRRRYARNVALMADAISRSFPPGTKVSHPRGGFTLWVEMPVGADALALYRQAKQQGITIAPGPTFSVASKFHHHVRLNAALWNERIETAIQTLGRLAHELLQT